MVKSSTFKRRHLVRNYEELSELVGLCLWEAQLLDGGALPQEPRLQTGCFKVSQQRKKMTCWAKTQSEKKKKKVKLL